jgi:RimJ/RimL family protein N-acetyltransferase
MKNAPLTLEGAVVRLVPLTHAHVDDLCEFGLEPQLWEATTIQVRTRAEMEAYIRTALDAQNSGTALPFVIEEIVSGKIVGTTRYHTICSEHRRLEIGFTWIALPWQRTTVNTEAKFLLLQHAFEILKCVRVEFRADAENERSCRALLRIGARKEGFLRNFRVTPSRGYRDLAVFSIIATEWPQVCDELKAKLKKMPNQSPDPSPSLVTPPAMQESRRD